MGDTPTNSLTVTGISKIDLCVVYGLSNIVAFTTRDEAYIDHVLIKNPSDSVIKAPLFNSDHCMI